MPDFFKSAQSKAQIYQQRRHFQNLLTEKESKMEKIRRPTPPGEILLTLYLIPNKISETKLAQETGVTLKHMSNIVNGRARITVKMAVRIAKVLDTTAQYWLNLQNAVDIYDLEMEILQKPL